MICTFTANPSVDLFFEVPRVAVDDINRITAAHRDPGGKGINVARMLRILGRRDVLALGFAGGRNGAWLRAELRRLGIACRFLPVAGKTRQIYNFRETGTGRLFRFNEPGPRVTPADLEAMTALVAGLPLGTGDFFVISGSVPPGVPDGFYARLIRLVRARGATAVLDSDNRLLAAGVTARPDIIKPNRFELGRLSGAGITGRKAAVAAARALVEAGVGTVVVSLGRDGALAVSAGATLSARAPAVRALSTIGAGDALLAGFLHKAARGAETAEALRTGVAAATASVTLPGTGFATRAGIRAMLARVSVRSLSGDWPVTDRLHDGTS